ncbi:hypothetical protein QBC39DRAFT_328567 [Podospora conica]|nr:hypothetical protein QBC39DRAFT_328567 [Schizothecium conicum]
MSLNTSLPLDTGALCRQYKHYQGSFTNWLITLAVQRLGVTVTSRPESDYPMRLWELEDTAVLVATALPSEISAAAMVDLDDAIQLRKQCQAVFSQDPNSVASDNGGHANMIQVLERIQTALTTAWNAYLWQEQCNQAAAMERSESPDSHRNKRPPLTRPLRSYNQYWAQSQWTSPSTPPHVPAWQGQVWDQWPPPSTPPHETGQGPFWDQWTSPSTPPPHNEGQGQVWDQWTPSTPSHQAGQGQFWDHWTPPSTPPSSPPHSTGQGQSDESQNTPDPAANEAFRRHLASQRMTAQGTNNTSTTPVTASSGSRSRMGGSPGVVLPQRPGQLRRAVQYAVP